MPRARQDWPEHEVEVIIAMRKDGATFKEIAAVLERSVDQVKGYVNARRDELGIEPKQFQPSVENRGRLRRGFEYEWLGGMKPFHWIMTKPWGSSHAK